MLTHTNDDNDDNDNDDNDSDDDNDHDDNDHDDNDHDEKELLVACTGTLLTGCEAYRRLCQAELDALQRRLGRQTRVVLQVVSTEAQVFGLASLLA